MFNRGVGNHLLMDSDLTPLEQYILDRSDDSAVTRRRRLTVIFSGLLFAVALVAASLLSPSEPLVLGIALVYIAITIWERVAYANTVLAYKSLIRKLKAKIDEFEDSQVRQSRNPMET